MISKLVTDIGLPSIVQAVYMIPEEFETHINSKSCCILDAVVDGLILYDPKSFLQTSKKKAFS
ncbi:MAG: hypothetical protein H5T50_10700 [Nitrososphaeria archaeon]|nr:hypothetical protein [Nitrososphaeria archaeon]